MDQFFLILCTVNIPVKFSQSFRNLEITYQSSRLLCSLVLSRLYVSTGTISSLCVDWYYLVLCVHWYHFVFVCSLVLPHLCVFIGTISSFVFHWYLLVFVCSLVISRLCVFTGTYSSLCVHWYLFAFVCSPFRFDYCNSLLSALPL